MSLNSRIAALGVVSLAAGTAVNADTVGPVDVSVSWTIPGYVTATGFGAATLDETSATTGILTIDHTDFVLVPDGNGTTLSESATDVLTGAVFGNVFTPVAGTSTLNSCTPESGTNYCVGVLAASPFTFTSFGGSEDINNGGTVTAVGGPSTEPEVNQFYTYQFGGVVGPPPVPLPAGAWLLGSALLGLSGFGRSGVSATGPLPD